MRAMWAHVAQVYVKGERMGVWAGGLVRWCGHERHGGHVHVDEVGDDGDSRGGAVVVP